MSPPTRSLGRRVADWFWRSSARTEVERTYPELGQRAAQLAARARSSAELAGSALAPADPVELSAEPSACELYRQSAYWSLCALGSASDPTLDGRRYEERAWLSLDDATLSRAVERAERVDLLRTSLREGSFVYFAELPAAEVQLVCRELRKVAHSLLSELDRRSRALARIFVQRALGLGLVAVVITSIVMAGLALRSARESRNDLALGKPWRASSESQFGGCVSPQQQCTEFPNYFFHTQEENGPWLEVDLQGVRRISAVQVENRAECCAERAVPLIVEVSEDHQKWRTVGTRDAEFTSWRGAFPAVDAHWVRLRVPKVTSLHLARVRVIP